MLTLTEATHGNSTGLGFADVTTFRVAEEIDWQVMYMNGITSGIFGARRNHLPMCMPDDKRALMTSLRVCGQPQATALMVFMRDTLTLDELWISPSLCAEAEVHPRIEILDEVPLAFDAAGTMRTPWALEPFNMELVAA